MNSSVATPPSGGRILQVRGETLVPDVVQQPVLAATSGTAVRVWVTPGVAEDVARCLLECAERGVIPGERLAGGRGSVWVVSTGTAGRIVVRPYLRGGLVQWFVRDWYLGRHPRCLEELETLLFLAQRGVPVVEGLAAASRSVGGIGYRAWLATRFWEGARTLWAWWCSSPGEAERRQVLEAVGAALADLHRAGVVHPDLNASNILVRGGGGQDCVRLIDFDRARRIAGVADPTPTLRRLARSLRKLDPKGTVVHAADWKRLETSLWRAFTAA